MIRQIEFTLRPRSRGFHPITDEIEANLPPLFLFCTDRKSVV